MRRRADVALKIVLVDIVGKPLLLAADSSTVRDWFPRPQRPAVHPRVSQRTNFPRVDKTGGPCSRSRVSPMRYRQPCVLLPTHARGRIARYETIKSERNEKKNNEISR